MSHLLRQGHLRTSLFFSKLGWMNRMNILASGHEQPEEVSVHLLYAFLQQGEQVIIVDVREEWEYRLCKIEGSIHMPLAELGKGLDTLPKDKMIVTVCHHGVRSRRASNLMKQNGFSAVASLNGGIDAWALNIDSTISRY